MTIIKSFRIPDEFMYVINRCTQLGYCKNNTEVVLEGLKLIRDNYKLKIFLTEKEAKEESKIIKEEEKIFLEQWKKDNL